MNVLQVNKFWFPLGGVNTYLTGVVGELRRRGHAVAEFGMEHPENVASDWAGFFVPQVDLSSAGRGLSLGGKVAASARMLYDPRAGRALARLCEAFEPEVAHVHLFERHLTAAAVRALARRGVPLVQTFHDYSFVCANYTLMRGMTVPCEMECMRKGYHRAVVCRCVKRSRAASALGALELVLRREVFRYHRDVDLFVSPSAYLRGLLLEGGLDPARVLHVPNYVDVTGYRPAWAAGEYVLFVGRLSFEKGLWTLLDAAAELADLPFRIVGRGPEETALAGAVQARGLENVRLEGFRQGEQLQELYRGALCVAVPSEWPENSPMVVYEAFASGKPVVGTATGGLPELVRDGLDGLIVPPADAAALAQALGRLRDAAAEASEMGHRAYERVVTEYGLERHVDRLEELYQRVARGDRRTRHATPARAREAVGT